MIYYQISTKKTVVFTMAWGGGACVQKCRILICSIDHAWKQEQRRAWHMPPTCMNMSDSIFKMAAIAAILDGGGYHWKETSSYIQQTPKKFNVKHSNVLKLFDRNRIQDGCHSRHLGCPLAGIIQNNLPVKDRNQQKKFQVKRVNGSQVIWRKPNSRWLP